MKKQIFALAACALALVLTACGAKAAQVRPAQLTEREVQLVELVEAGDRTQLFDLALPQGATQLDIMQWSLVDGAWQGEMTMGGVAGSRLCLRVAGRGELVYAAVGGAASRVEGDLTFGELPAGSGCTETWLTEPAALALDTETPLYLYIESADGTVEVFAPSAYETPEKLAGYARVTAVTVRPTA